MSLNLSLSQAQTGPFCTILDWHGLEWTETDFKPQGKDWNYC